jgi:import inner membrane translocase subunit TIM50
VSGKPIKDITQLNRDVNKVILVDINPESYSLQPENGIFLKPWTGESGDNELYRLERFLHGKISLFIY